MWCWDAESLHSEEDVTDNSGQAVMSDLKRRGWGYSSDQIQFKNTVLIDLTAIRRRNAHAHETEDALQRPPCGEERRDLRVGTVEDLAMLYKMYAETSVRDGFVIRDEDYYKTVWKLFMQVNATSGLNLSAVPLIAEVDGEPVAAIFVFYFRGTCILCLWHVAQCAS